MDVNEWRRVKELFASALEREPAWRDEFLAEACAGNESLRHEVQSLLAEHQEPAAMPSADVDNSAKERSNDHDSMSGRRIGAYRIVRRIGQGGMATVYLAVRADDQYKKCVAIKLIPLDVDNQDLLRRFRNEKQTLAALDHPNIVKLLDAGTTEDKLPYLVMDYVEGSRLDDYCDNHKLSTSERLRLFLSVCEGVQYAHQRLIIHRDLKPANILVNAEGTVKLLDFGIAKLINPDAALTLIVTRTREHAMTLAYASPEQVRGEPLSNATDVYSLGVILYELLTAHRLYESSLTFADMERAICDEEPVRPSAVVMRDLPERFSDEIGQTITADEISRRRQESDVRKLRGRLHGDLDAIAMMALRKEPQRRYVSVYEFAEDIRRHLQGLPVKARPSSLLYRGAQFLRRHKEAAVTTFFFVLLLAAAAAWYGASRTRAGVYHMSPIKGRRSLAVLGFKNLSGRMDANWLSTALSEMLTTELAAGEKIRTIPGENVARMKIDLSLPDADSLAQDTVARIHQNLGSDLIVVGSYLYIAGALRLDLRLQDAGSGEILKAFTEDGTEADLSHLVAKAGEQLRQKLGLNEVTQEEALAVRASLPSTPEATHFYAQGLAKLRVFDALGGRELLEKAVAEDGSSALAHSALAEAWSNLGYDEKAKETARRAVDLSKSLSQEERLVVEGRYMEMTKEWGRAIEIYQTLFDLFPDNIEYGRRLASAQTNAGKGEDALSTVSAMRQLPIPVRDDSGIDLAEAQAAHSRSDYKRQELAAESAERKARTIGAKLLLAAALIEKGAGLQGQDHFRNATAAFEESRQILAEAGDRAGAANATMRIGEMLRNQGDLSESKKMEEESLATFREIGDRKHEAMALLDIANILNQQGSLKAAQKEDEQALGIFRAIGSKPLEATVTNNIGILLWAQGDRSRAENAYRQSLALFEEIGNRRGAALALSNVGDTLLERGALDEAKLAYEKSESTAEQIGDGHDSAYALRGLGNIFMDHADLESARQRYESALASQTRMGERSEAALTRVSIAALAMEENRLADADSLASTALEEFRRENDQANQILAVTALARALLAQGKPAEAKKIVDDSQSIVSTSCSLDVLLLLAVADAQVKASRGRSTEALAGLQKAISQAELHGFFRSTLEGRLAAGQIEVKSHRATAGVVHLHALAKEARTKGFLLIARKAEDAAKSGHWSSY